MNKPSVPSLPIKSCFTSYPVLSLRNEDKQSITIPSAPTASTPTTVPLSDPYRSNRRPPAFVETLPPEKETKKF